MLRATLLERRRQSSPDGRRADAAELVARLDAWVGDVARQAIALYWPIRGEPDLDPLARRWSDAGARLGLPVVAARAAPLRFVEWLPGEPLVDGPHRIPRPASDLTLRPTLVVVPCVGFDPRGWRLGYGGGYYDRTLAALRADGGPSPRTVGVAWDDARIDGFEPLATDVPLDAIVTPSSTFRPSDPAVR